MSTEMKRPEEVKVTVIPKEKEIDQVITDHVLFSMAAGAIPLPVLDILAVSAIQLDMLKQLARKYEIVFDDEAGKSIVTSLLGSTIGTTIGRAGASAVKAIPGIGTILGIGSQVALAGVTTFAIGQLFNQHFGNHKPLADFNLEDVKDYFEELMRKGKEFVDNLQKNAKHNAQDMKEETALVLRKMSDNGVISPTDFEKIIKAMNIKKE